MSAESRLEKQAPSQVWNMPAGEASVLGYRLGGDYWMEWPGFATFQFHPARSTVTAFVRPGVPASAVEDVWRRGVLPLVLVTRGLEALHASAVTTARGVIAFCARSGTGKSTLACALRARGFGQWADDAVVFQSEDDGAITAMPLPFSVRLDEQSREYAGAAPIRNVVEEGTPAPLAAICVLSRLSSDSVEPFEVRKVTGSEALTAVLPHAHVFDPADNLRGRQMVERYLHLVDRVPVYAAAFRPGPVAWPAVLDAFAERFPA